MTSVLNVDTIADKAGTGPVALTKQSPAKGWYHLDNDYSGTNPTGGNVTVQDSFNISSITDNGTGDYTMAWTNSFGNAFYSITQQGQYRDDATGSEYGFQEGIKGAPTTSSYGFTWEYYNNSTYDPSKWWAVAHGDLA